MFLLYFFLFLNCKSKKHHLSKISVSQISIDNSLEPNADVENFIKPYRDYINTELDSILTYSANTYSKTDGFLNTAIGNYMADVVYDQANPIFKTWSGHEIDMVLLNHGGIRAIVPQGPISARHAYELMPFENTIVIVALKGSQVNNLTTYLAKNKIAHPISKLQLILNANFNIIEAKIKGRTVNPKKTYYVATSDYLLNGGDNMTFFKAHDTVYETRYKIRNALIDNFKKVDTINPEIDLRLIQIKD